MVADLREVGYIGNCSNNTIGRKTLFGIIEGYGFKLLFKGSNKVAYSREGFGYVVRMGDDLYKNGLFHSRNRILKDARKYALAPRLSFRIGGQNTNGVLDVIKKVDKLGYKVLGKATMWEARVSDFNKHIGFDSGYCLFTDMHGGQWGELNGQVKVFDC